MARFANITVQDTFKLNENDIDNYMCKSRNVIEHSGTRHFRFTRSLNGTLLAK